MNNSGYMLHKFNHPLIPKIIDFEEINNGYLFIVESYDGKSLSKIVDDFGAQNEKDVVEWGKQLCDVVFVKKKVHRRGSKKYIGTSAPGYV